MKYATCECARMADTLFLCHPVQLPEAALEALYIGPGGVYAIVSESSQRSPESIQSFLRHFFGTSRIELYLRGRGRYNARNKEIGDLLSEENLQTDIQVHTQGSGFFLWDNDMLERHVERIRHEDARNRGVYRDPNGTWFVARNGNFVPLSDKDPTNVLRLTLFGGILGAHRFALGKWASGILYLFTGGLIGLGWFMDLLQLALGGMKDKKKQLLSKPDPLPFFWYLAGFAASFVLFCLYAVFTGILSGALGQLSQRMTENISPEQATALMSFLQRISGQ